MSEKLAGAAKSILIGAGITPGSRIVIGVSGGPDSLALLHFLRDFTSPSCLWVAHLNHGLRPEADDEAEFVAQTAETWGLLFRGRKVDVTRLARYQGWSVEEAGREARYQFLADLADECHVEAAVVAHNADDQAETVLLHLIRGSGLSGLKGMRPVVPMPGKPSVKLVRPFLMTTRQEIEDYCHKQGLQPILDSTNRDPVYLRNRVRHELLPMLAVFNPRVKKHLQQFSDLAAADEAFLADQTDLAWQEILEGQGTEWLRLNLGKWRSLPLSLRRRTLRRAVAELRPTISEISFRTIDLAHQISMEKDTGAKATLPGGIALLLEYGQILLTTGLEQIPMDHPQLPYGKSLSLAIPGHVTLDEDWIVTASESGAGLAEVRSNRDPWLAYFDIGQRRVLAVRSRSPGEQFQPLGMDGRSSSIQDVMVNRKLPARLREHWPVVATEEHLVWLVGVQMDDRAKVTENSQRIIQLTCHKMSPINIGSEKQS